MTSQRLPPTAPQTRPVRQFKAGRFSLQLGQRTLLMGVLNLTPDSFSLDGRLSNKSFSVDDHISFAQELVEQGADIIDIGAESSRPGAERVSVKAELQRLMPTLKKLVKAINAPISVDTYKPLVAKQALEAGASIINNIRGCQMDASILRSVKAYNAGLVLMHMKGTPKTMQKMALYKNLMQDIRSDFKLCLEKCLEMGIKKDRIIIDPGLGFAKTADQNLEILRNLKRLHSLGCPILIGPSRKSFIGQILSRQVHERLMGTACAVSLGIAYGAHMVRVHDVGAMKDVARMADAIIKG